MLLMASRLPELATSVVFSCSRRITSGIYTIVIATVSGLGPECFVDRAKFAKCGHSLTQYSMLGLVTWHVVGIMV